MRFSGFHSLGLGLEVGHDGSGLALIQGCRFRVWAVAPGEISSVADVQHNQHYFMTEASRQKVSGQAPGTTPMP